MSARLLKRITVLFLTCMLFFTSSIGYAEEDLHFVDSDDTTGYYVDLNSVSIESDQVLNAKIAVIKIPTNRMFVYTMRFDHEKRLYKILGAKVLVYDTKKVLETTGASDVERTYGPASVMQEIVEYILYPEKR